MLELDWMLVAGDGQSVEASDSLVGHPLLDLFAAQSRESDQLLDFLVCRVGVVDVTLIPVVQSLGRVLGYGVCPGSLALLVFLLFSLSLEGIT